MVVGHVVGMCVVLVEAAHAVHLVVDAAGDVLNVLHVGPGQMRGRGKMSTQTNKQTNKQTNNSQNPSGLNQLGPLLKPSLIHIHVI